MGKKTTKKSETDAEGRKKMVEAAVDLLKTEFANLTGKDQAKCADKALLEAVRKKMGWDYAPGGEFLFDELRRHRLAQAEAPKEEKPKRRAPGPSIPPEPVRDRSKRRAKPKQAPAKSVQLANQDLNQDEYHDQY